VSRVESTDLGSLSPKPPPENPPKNNAHEQPQVSFNCNMTAKNKLLKECTLVWL